MSGTETMERARDYALKLLAYRPRSRAELQTRLAQKGYTEETINQVLTLLERHGWVDDAEFAALWVRHRTRTRTLGPERLRRELAQKGVDREIAEAAIAVAIDESSELMQARAVAEKVRAQLAGVEPGTASRRLAGRLARRGFHSDVIWRVVRETLAGGEDIGD